MKPKLHVVELVNVPIFEQLRWEEALLRADERNWCLLNRGSIPSIVMGVSGKTHDMIHLHKFQSDPLPLIRRFSGGGTVVVDENTFFVTLICQANALPIPPFPRHILHWTGELYRPLFCCQGFEIRDNDYTFNGRKWGGNAQSISRGRWLHHSSLLWDYNPLLMNYLTIPPKTPSYREDRSHSDFLCRLCEFLPDLGSFQEKFREELDKNFSLINESVEEIKWISKKEHRKVTTLCELG